MKKLLRLHPRQTVTSFLSRKPGADTPMSLAKRQLQLLSTDLCLLERRKLEESRAASAPVPVFSGNMQAGRKAVNPA